MQANGETAEAVDRANEAALQRVGEETPALQARVALADELDIAERIYAEAQGLVSSFLNHVKIGSALDVAPIHRLADELQQSVLRNPNALSCLGRIREKRRVGNHARALRRRAHQPSARP